MHPGARALSRTATASTARSAARAAGQGLYGKLREGAPRSSVRPVSLLLEQFFLGGSNLGERFVAADGTDLVAAAFLGCIEGLVGEFNEFGPGAAVEVVEACRPRAERQTDLGVAVPAKVADGQAEACAGPAEEQGCDQGENPHGRILKAWAGRTRWGYLAGGCKETPIGSGSRKAQNQENLDPMHVRLYSFSQAVVLGKGAGVT